MSRPLLLRAPPTGRSDGPPVDQMDQLCPALPLTTPEPPHLYTCLQHKVVRTATKIQFRPGPVFIKRLSRSADLGSVLLGSKVKVRVWTGGNLILDPSRESAWMANAIRSAHFAHVIQRMRAAQYPLRNATASHNCDCLLA
ncbi:hypothetical protein AAFF_G00026610 [Aldrovandia affinis]|uniref:Uncharacterized protein n=1 Tax=Aldrovandia affinis TaxID=143900 RepID=A0AAD7WGI1_9TELE|nr:hypothetical protein AAFF_G00026610 [Aldrovandia affinis]